MENKKGPGMILKIVVWSLAGVLIAGIAIGGVTLLDKAGNALDAVTSEWSSDESSDGVDMEYSETPGVSSGKDDDVVSEPEPEPEPVKALVNYGMSVHNGMNMGVVDNRPALRNLVYMTGELYSDVMMFGKAYVLWAPLDYFKIVNPNNEPTCNYISEFRKKGYTYKLLSMELTSFQRLNDDRYVAQSPALTHIKYQEVNTKFVCMGVLTFDDGKNYEYSTFEGTTYESSARSVGFVASAVVNDYHYGLYLDLIEEDEYDQVYWDARYFLNESVDLKAGLSKPTEDYSVYELKQISDQIQMKVGSKIQINTSVTPSATLSDICIWLRPIKRDGLFTKPQYSHGVVEVDNQGNVKAVGNGLVTVFTFSRRILSPYPTVMV